MQFTEETCGWLIRSVVILVKGCQHQFRQYTDGTYCCRCGLKLEVIQQ
jgi:hypothetical protein